MYLHALWAASVAGQAFLLARLFRNGLWRSYGALTVFLAASLICSAVLFRIPLHTSRYFWAWLFAQCAILPAQAAMVAGAFARQVRSYCVERWEVPALITASLGCAAIAAWASLTFPPTEWRYVYTTIMVWRRATLLCLAIFAAVSSTAFLLPAKRSPNVIAYSRFVLVLIGQAAVGQWFIANSSREAIAVINVASMAIATACYLVLAIALTPSGEHASIAALGPAERAAHEARKAEMLGWLSRRQLW